ncbi:hypothetical protein PoB_007675700 [Plakobranchus ocellatus]|uniref:Uncharacterized protein n=1 Tax=Plakobranchus ocellatus TaxID=259542 RepID=A0AAV4E0Z0_9GAST|nr:hypothetical protein PoB_007675700 [Plakobranchus ocellatus]
MLWTACLRRAERESVKIEKEKKASTLKEVVDGEFGACVYSPPIISDVDLRLSRLSIWFVRGQLELAIEGSLPIPWFGLFWDRAGLQQGDLRLSGPLSGQIAGDGSRTSGRRVNADFTADSQYTVPPD